MAGNPYAGPALWHRPRQGPLVAPGGAISGGTEMAEVECRDYGCGGSKARALETIGQVSRAPRRPWWERVDLFWQTSHLANPGLTRANPGLTRIEAVPNSHPAAPGGGGSRPPHRPEGDGPNPRRSPLARPRHSTSDATSSASGREPHAVLLRGASLVVHDICGSGLIPNLSLRPAGAGGVQAGSRRGEER